MLHLTLFTIGAGILLMMHASGILRLFTSDPEIAQNGRQAIFCIFPFYFLYSINQVYMGD